MDQDILEKVQWLYSNMENIKKIWNANMIPKLLLNLNVVPNANLYF